jgi:hypothetical protein
LAALERERGCILFDIETSDGTFGKNSVGLSHADKKGSTWRAARK